jgi:hypothetical protein
MHFFQDATALLAMETVQGVVAAKTAAAATRETGGDHCCTCRFEGLQAKKGMMEARGKAIDHSLWGTASAGMVTS